MRNATSNSSLVLVLVRCAGLCRLTGVVVSSGRCRWALAQVRSLAAEDFERKVRVLRRGAGGAALPSASHFVLRAHSHSGSTCIIWAVNGTARQHTVKIDGILYLS